MIPASFRHYLFGCGGNYNNHIRIELDGIEKFNLDCYSDPPLNENWGFQQYTLTISDTYEEFTGTYSYVLSYQDFEFRIYDHTNCENCTGTITLVR